MTRNFENSNRVPRLDKNENREADPVCSSARPNDRAGILCIEMATLMSKKMRKSKETSEKKERKRCGRLLGYGMPGTKLYIEPWQILKQRA